jgi:NADPH:quinone reductase-like Zn-dependent oxidoreductase
MKTTMKAMYLKQKSGPEGLTLGEIPKPKPKVGEVLIEVHATAVTPTELQWFPTFNTPTGEPRTFPIVLSHELTGKVAALGDGVANLKVGDEVYGINDWFTNGAQAEFCVAPASGLAPVPSSLDHVQSAVVPISALTAWQGLFDRLNLMKGQRILIHGAAGGVGIFAVQLAHWHGARVIATASAGNLDFVRSLGADQVIDYQNKRFDDDLCDIDVVFDSVGGDTLQRSWKLLRADGKIVTIAAQSEGIKEQRVRDSFMLVKSDGAQLAKISNLIDSGEIRVFSGGAFPLAQARDAYERALKGKMRGKIALSVAE